MTSSINRYWQFMLSPNQPRVYLPTLNTNEMVVAVATPQQYGAAGDGLTDDSGAFQAAMNAVYNSGGSGGGVVFVPAGNYAFYHDITIPTGVTLHGDWKDWTKSGGGLVGTTFKVYFGAGQGSGTPFIVLSGSTALRDVNIWYPNQNPAGIIAYPFRDWSKRRLCGSKCGLGQCLSRISKPSTADPNIFYPPSLVHPLYKAN